MTFGLFFAFFFSVSVSFLMTYKAIGWSYRLNFLDIPKAMTRKNHAASTPLLGGVAVFVAFFFSIYFLMIIAFGMKPIILEYFPETAEYLAGAFKQFQKLNFIFLGETLILLLGLQDDKNGMNPEVKLGAIFLIALILFYLDIKITLFINYPSISFGLTLAWILFLTNSFNLLDNMNGLSSGTAIACSLNLFCIAIYLEQYFISFYVLTFIGALSGFFYFNFFKSKIFLGDSGALFIGLNLAITTILETFFIAGKSSSIAVFIPVFLFLIPIYDTLSVIVIRMKNRMPIYKGDLNHFSHRLEKAGYTKKNTVVIINFLAFIVGFLSLLLLSNFSFSSSTMILLITISFLGIMIFEWLLKIGRKAYLSNARIKT